MSDKAGLEPRHLDVVLTKNGDWIYEIRCRVNGVITNWPAGGTWSVVLEDSVGTVWPATMDDEWARWDVDKDDTASIPAGTPVGWLWEHDGTELVYWTGEVVRRG